MKVIKPQKLGLLSRTFEHGDNSFLVLTLAAFFPLDRPSALLPEVAMWKFIGEELGTSAPLDEGLPKQHGEVLLSSRAYPSGGRARLACQVRVRLGAVDKVLRVVGNRHWDDSGVPSAPEPFSEMPLTYAQAFGGPGFASNPLGKGWAPVKGPGGHVHSLPNVEDPRHFLRSPRDKPEPAGLLPYELGWPQRISKAGTYDRRWLETRYPGFAEDMHSSYFNTAPEDQRIAGYFQGGERFVLENLHPTLPVIEGELPRLTARAFVTVRTAEGERLRECSTRLDTVWLFPHALRGVLLFRALTKVAEDDAADVLHCLTAFEDHGASHPVQHYEQVLARRLDKKSGHFFALKDEELLPQSLAAPALTEPVLEEFVVGGEVLRAALRRKREREHERARESIRQAGVDPDSILPAVLPPDEPAPTLEELPLAIARAEAQLEEHQAAAERKRAEAEQTARQICSAHGIDYDKVMKDAQDNAGGPPRFSARAEWEKLEQLASMARSQGQPQLELEALLTRPGFAENLMRGEAKLREAYKQFAHHFPAVMPLSSESSARLRAHVELLHRERLPFTNEDLTGADLSGIDLSGADLRGVFMEGANLHGANLRGTNLTGAVLARANLSGAFLSGACLRDANLGSAQLFGAHLDGGADLAGATLASANLKDATLRGAKLTGSDLSGAQLGGADFQDVTAAGTNFLQSDLSRAVFRGADLTQCNFLECTVAGVDFSGAILTSAVFVAAKGDGAIFRQARLDNLRLVQGCSFANADFQRAKMTEANLRGTRLQTSNFSGAMLDRSDLSECDLRGARFYRATARESRWVRADLQGASFVSINLMNAILQKAHIAGTDFTGANLFRVDLAKVRGKAASVRDALLLEVRLVQRENA